MPEKVFGLTESAAKLVGRMAGDYRQRLPPVGRRTRRVYNGGGATDKNPRHIWGEILEWEPAALHGAAAIVAVRWKDAPGNPFDYSIQGDDVVIAVYDITPGGDIFGDGSGLVGLWVRATLMMPWDQIILCPPETGVAGESPATSACRWLADNIACTVA